MLDHKQNIITVSRQIHILKIICEAKAPQLRALEALAEDQSSFPESMVCCLQTPVTPAPRGIMMPSAGTYTYVHTNTYKQHTYTHNQNIKENFKLHRIIPVFRVLNKEYYRMERWAPLAAECAILPVLVFCCCEETPGPWQLL